MEQDFRDFEVIVVDGGSTDGTHELLRSLHVKALLQSAKYVPNAENCGVAAASGRILAFVDDDVVAPKNWLREIVKAYDRSNADCVGGAVIDVDRKPLSPGVAPLVSFLNILYSAVICENKHLETGRVLRSGEVTDNFDRQCSTYLNVDHLRGCNMSFRKEVFDVVGPFDETYERTSLRYETDFCLRARAKGFRLIYNPNAVVLHGGGQHISWVNGKSLRTKLYYNTMNDTLFVMKLRKKIDAFSVPRFVLRQLLLAERYLSLAIRKKNTAYLYGLWGMLKGFEKCVVNSTARSNGDRHVLGPACS